MNEEEEEEDEEVGVLGLGVEGKGIRGAPGIIAEGESALALDNEADGGRDACRILNVSRISTSGSPPLTGCLDDGRGMFEPRF